MSEKTGTITWIPVSYGLPDTNRPVIIWKKNCKWATMAKYNPASKRWNCFGHNGASSTRDIAFWAEINNPV